MPFRALKAPKAPGDGFFASAPAAVVRCREDFDRLARTILTRAAASP